MDQYLCFTVYNSGMPLCDICFIGQTQTNTQTDTNTHTFFTFLVFSALQNGVTFQVIELKMAINKSRKFPWNLGQKFFLYFKATK